VELINIIPDHFTVTPDADTIYAGESVNVLAIAKDSKDEEEPLDEQTLITYLDISEEGSFIVGSDTTFQQVTVPYGKAKSGEVKYYAPDNGSGDVSPKEVLIFVSRAEHPERYGECLVSVIRFCPFVRLSKEEINPGDTIDVEVLGMKENGDLIPYPSDQLFNISIISGAEAGELVSLQTEKRGVDITDVPTPALFIANQNIGADSVKVDIKAWLASNSGGGGSASVISEGVKGIPSQGLTVDKVIQMANGMNKGAAYRLLKSKLGKVTDNKVSEKKDLVEVNKLKAALTTLDLGEICKWFASLWIKESELVIDKTPTGILGITRDAPPLMPQYEIMQVHLKNYDGGEVNYSWDITVKYNRPDGGYTEGVYKGTGKGNNSDVIILPINWAPNIIRGGDLIMLHVKAQTTEFVKEKTTERSPFTVFGLNPTKASVKAMLTLEQQVIAYWESGRTFHQFLSDYEVPVFGPPHGFGIMQLDPPSNDEQIWNWQANVNEGIVRYNQKSGWASDYHIYLQTGDRNRNGRLLHPLADAQRGWYLDEYQNPISYNADALEGDDLLLDIYQLYNGGAYWRWVLDDEEEPLGSGYWEAQPINEYADRLYEILTNVRNNIFPAGWND
jgi:hypothetical protein